jgi:hypothetical protein
MATSKGVIQGYTGVVAGDARHQIIVEAQTHGTGSEQELPLPVVEALKNQNLQALEQKHIDALIADHELRKRDERFASEHDVETIEITAATDSQKTSPITAVRAVRVLRTIFSTTSTPELSRPRASA